MIYSSGRKMRVEVYNTENHEEHFKLNALLAREGVVVYSVHTAACAYSDESCASAVYHFVTVVYSV